MAEKVERFFLDFDHNIVKPEDADLCIEVTLNEKGETIKWTYYLSDKGRKKLEEQAKKKAGLDSEQKSE